MDSFPGGYLKDEGKKYYYLKELSAYFERAGIALSISFTCFTCFP